MCALNFAYSINMFGNHTELSLHTLPLLECCAGAQLRNNRKDLSQEEVVMT